ncbi:MAG: nucleoside triphosphate pyrophosphohydrolase [Clostridiales bacterium]|jgi:tetrapyrrole methylase family protein/MazG family protein|nr:nucleoside triphosphate pyrophosphohydrolase [Clostridiales bacterium]
MVDFEYKNYYNVYDLERIIALLRSENGCPWDREQTHESIRRNLLEEAYEAVEAIDEKNAEHLREELGDLLTQIVFHSSIQEEQGSFKLDDVADAVCKKLIYRHPHVFGGVKAEDSAEVLENWDELKRREKGQSTTASAMDSVARSLPALWRAEKIQSKAKKVGFDWDNVSGALDKLFEEAGELREAIASGRGIEEELGDLLFSAVNVARFTKTDPEEALHSACEKFTRRFRYIECEAERMGRELGEMTLEEMDKLYTKAKEL